MQAAVALLGAALFLAYAQGSASDLGTRLQTEWREPITGMAFRLVRPGRLQMGSPLFEIGREAQERIHEVSLTRPTVQV